MTKRVIIALLGPEKDAEKLDKRWDKWRPTVALVQNRDFPVDRIELLYQEKHQGLVHTIKEDIGQVSPTTLVQLHRVSFDDPWNFEKVYTELHGFVRTYPFIRDRKVEEYLVHITTGTHVAQICLFLLAQSRHIPGNLIQTIPPWNIRKNHGRPYTVIDLDLQNYPWIEKLYQKERDESVDILKSGIKTKNPAYERLIGDIRNVAKKTREPILITGPTGSGKTKLARHIFDIKKENQIIGPGKFVERNCATIQGDTVKSALFGHKKGAFTDAKKDQIGILKDADKGVVFLDEIGELDLGVQAMLLRAIEEKRFTPLGTQEDETSDFQLICGTNRDLPTLVAQGLFREDLLARINLWTFTMPSLKERPEDIDPNLDNDLEKFAQNYNRHVEFTEDARARYIRFATSGEALWKGNFRDFRGSVIRMATLADDGVIRMKDVEREIGELIRKWKTPEMERSESLLEKLLGDKVADLDRFDRVQLNEVISVCASSGTISEAGRKLFSVSMGRKKSVNDADRLKKYLARFDLGWEAIKKVAQS